MGEADQFRTWISRRYPPVAPEGMWPLVDRLRLEPGAGIFDNKMQAVANGAVRVSYEILARWLVGRALEAGPEQAIDNLHRYLASSSFTCYEVMALGGLEIEKEVDLGQRIKLIRFVDAPDSLAKLLLQPSHPMLYLSEPAIALVRQLEHPRIHFDPGSNHHRELQLSLLTTELDEARLALTLVGPCAPVSFGSWFAPDDSVPSGAVWGGSAGYVEVGRTRKLTAEDHAKAREIVRRYRDLAPPVKDWVRIPLSRLNAALRRRSIVDSAIDLRIAMEALFLHDLTDDRGELSFRLRIRAARFLGRDLDERKGLHALFRNLYTIGSMAVHTGGLPPSHEGTETHALLEEGYSTVARAIEEVMLRGQIDWIDVTLS